LEDYLDHDPIHLSFSGGCAEMDQLEEQLKTELGSTVKILSTKYLEQDFTLLDVVNPAASKGAGVAAAAAELGVAREDIMAIGDNYNDLEMLLFAGTAWSWQTRRCLCARSQACIRPLPIVTMVWRSRSNSSYSTRN